MSTVPYGGINIPTATEMGKELLSWETRNRIPGWRPENHQFPKMLYRAQKRYDGVVKCMDTFPVESPFLSPDQVNREIARVEAFNRSCQLIVRDEFEMRNAFDQGWCETPQKALEAHEKLERAIGDAAAERAAQDAKMSERAQAEVKAFEDSTEHHVPVIPEKRTVKVDKRTKAYKDSLKASA